MEELGRLALAGALTVVLILAAIGVRLLARRLRPARGDVARDLASRYGFDPGQPGILFIVSDGCNQCTVLQEPVLATVAARAGAVVRRLAATEAHDVVQRFGIATFPATVVIDSRRVLRGVNLGFADAETLSAQVI